jgi:hypothetical protein
MKLLKAAQISSQPLFLWQNEFAADFEIWRKG